MGDSILTIIGGLLILIAVIVVIFVKLKNEPTEEDKDQALEFLYGLSDVIYQKVVSIITEFDISKYDSIEELEVDILSDIYDDIWDYVEEEIKSYDSDDLFTAIAVKVINKEFVTNFVDDLLNQFDISNKINSIWAANFEAKVNLVDTDESVDSYKDQSLYVEDLNENNLEPAIIVEPTEEELALLNPPTDEGEGDIYNPEDSSVELIEDNEEELDYFFDSKGRKRNKATGRYMK